MARRGFGGTALRAALGAVSGITEGLQQREILAAQRKQQDEINALNRFNALRAAGFGASLARPAVPQSERETFALPDAGMPSPTMSSSAMGQALTRATQEDFGVSSRSTGMLDTPIRLALETAPRRMTQAHPSALPRQRITLGGMDLELETPEEVALKTQQREEALAARTAEAARQAKIQEFERIKAAYKSGGLSEEDATLAALKMPEFSDLRATPSVRATMRGQDITAATTRRGQDISAATSMRGQDLSTQVAGTAQGSKEQSAMQQMMVARVNVARQQARAANAEMEKFEESLIEGTRKIGAIEAQLANEMFKDTRFNRLAEAQLNKMNPELAMYVRNAKAIGAAERLVMPRGGSNLLMNIETALAGVGPGATPELIRNTQAFRRGLVEGVQKETPEALMEAENARVESAIGTDAERRGVSQPTTPDKRPPLSSFKR